MKPVRPTSMQQNAWIAVWDICSSGISFGDKVMFFGGDFRQIPPILKHVSREEVVYSYLNRFYLWHHVKVVKVTIKMFRQIWSFHEVSDVNELSNILLRVIEGTKPENENQMINIDTKNIIRADSIAGLVTS